MRMHHAALIALVVALGAPALVTAQEKLGTYEDRIAVEDVMARYVWAVDSFDADGYVAVFTEDALSNVRITFPKADEAVYQSYWQTVRRDKDDKMIAAAMGRSEDHLVKRNGKWQIRSRKLTVFTD